MRLLRRHRQSQPLEVTVQFSGEGFLSLNDLFYPENVPLNVTGEMIRDHLHQRSHDRLRFISDLNLQYDLVIDVLLWPNGNRTQIF